MAKKKTKRITTHPGEVLRAEYLAPLGLSARALAAAIGVPANRISELARERRSMSADTAIRLGRHFNTSSRFWMNLQAAHDLSKAELEMAYSVRRGTCPILPRRNSRNALIEPIRATKLGLKGQLHERHATRRLRHRAPSPQIG